MVLKQVADKIYEKVSEQKQASSIHVVTTEDEKKFAECVKKELSEDMDLGETFRRNADPISEWTDYQTKEIHRAVVNNQLLIQSLEEPSDLQRVRGDKIDFGAYEPKKGEKIFVEHLGRRLVF